MPARRPLLAALVGAATTTLTGCLGTNDSRTDPPRRSSPPTNGSVDEPSTTPVPTPPDDCSARYRPTVEATAPDVDPVPYPDLPSDLDERSARTFATAFERAWRHNDALRDRPSVDRITADVSAGDVTALGGGDGFVVETSATVGFTYTSTSTPGTPTPEPTAVAGTSGRLRSRYLVTERFARRVVDTNATPAAVGDGTLVACSE